MKSRLLPLLLMLIVLAELLTGCWDSREVEELGIISGIAVDLTEDGRMRTVFQFVNTAVLSKGSSGRGLEFEKAYRNVAIDADNLFDAMKQLSLQTTVRRFFAQTEILLVSENFAQSRGMAELIDYFLRDPQIRPNTWVVITQDDVAELMDIGGRINPVPTYLLADLLKQHALVSSYAPLRLGEFNRIMQSPSSHPFTACVEVAPNHALPAENGHGINNGMVPEQPKLMAVTGTAVFRKDKMAGWLDQQQSRGLLWLRGEVKNGQIKFPIPGREDKTMSVEILEARSKLEPRIENGQFVMEVKIKVSSAVEQMTAYYPLDESESLKELEEAQSQAVAAEIQSALDKAQKQYQLDIFGFGEAVHRSHPEEWQQIKDNWSDIFPGVQVRLEIHSTIRHTNLTSSPPQIENEQSY